MKGKGPKREKACERRGWEVRWKSPESHQTADVIMKRNPSPGLDGSAGGHAVEVAELSGIQPQNRAELGGTGRPPTSRPPRLF